MKLNGMWFPQIVDRDSRNIYPIPGIYITKIVVLASEPVGGRSQATEFPCFSTCQTSFHIFLIYPKIKQREEKQEASRPESSAVNNTFSMTF